MSERVIHACNWSLNYVESNLKLIKDQGFTAIQLSPMQDHKKGNEWWKRYQPINFKIGNDLGSKEDLIRLCDKANKLGLKISSPYILWSGLFIVIVPAATLG